MFSPPALFVRGGGGMEQDCARAVELYSQAPADGDLDKRCRLARLLRDRAPGEGDINYARFTFAQRNEAAGYPQGVWE